MGKGEIARNEQFLLFPQCFQKACFPGASKGVIVWEWVNSTTQSRLLMTLKKKALENTVGKGQNADNKHFLLFPQVFYSIKARNHHFSNPEFVIGKCFHFGHIQNFAAW